MLKAVKREKTFWVWDVLSKAFFFCLCRTFHEEENSEIKETVFVFEDFFAVLFEAYLHLKNDCRRPAQEQWSRFHFFCAFLVERMEVQMELKGGIKQRF